MVDRDDYPRDDEEAARLRAQAEAELIETRRERNFWHAEACNRQADMRAHEADRDALKAALDEARAEAAEWRAVALGMEAKQGATLYLSAHERILPWESENK